MNQKHIKEIKQVLTEWNPIGERKILYPDLNNYETEVIDILFFLDKTSSIEKINKTVAQILSEAFNLNVDLTESKKYAEKIKSILIK
jgi:hypothetical protein